MIDRRVFVGVAAGTLLATVLLAHAQTDSRIRRIGFLEAGAASANQHFLDAFESGLRDLGYVRGRNIVIDVRWAEGRAERFPRLLAELIGLQPDVLVVASHVGALAAKSATNSIPVVFVGASDPVGTGLVASLARPGGNMTGLSRAVEDGTLGKAVQLLKDVVPAANRVAILWNPVARIEPRRREVDAAMRSLDMNPIYFEVYDRGGFDAAFADMRRQRVDALVVLGDPLTLVNRTTIVKLANESRIPAVYEFAEFARAGGLMAYAPSVIVLFRRAALHVDKILKVGKPGDLPVEQPTVYELVINLQAAKALGLAIPQALLRRADEVIQ